MMVGSARRPKFRIFWITGLVIAVSLLTTPTRAEAGEWWKRLCAKLESICRTVVGPKKSLHPIYSPHYGYYPNVWRRWPADWEDWRQRYNSLRGGEPVTVVPPEQEDGASEVPEAAPAPPAEPAPAVNQ